MHRRCIRFKGCYVSPGSNLYEVLVAKDMKAAEKQYKVLDAQFKRDWPEITNGIGTSTTQGVPAGETLQGVENTRGSQVLSSPSTGRMDESQAPGNAEEV